MSVYMIAEYTSKTTSELRPNFGTFATVAECVAYISENLFWVNLDDLQNNKAQFSIREVTA